MPEVQQVPTTATKRTHRMSQQAEAARADTALDHMCFLDIDSEPYAVRMTGVICTIGPSCDSVQQLKAMMESGMSVCRLNLAHGSYEYHGLVIKNIREAASRMDIPAEIAIATDITGPGIRVGRLRSDLGGQIYLKKGSHFKLTTDLYYKDEGTTECVYVDNQVLIDSCQLGSHIVIEDGPLTLIVDEKGSNYVSCITEHEGQLVNKDFCNISNVRPSQAKLSLKDCRDIKFTKDHNVDIILASFVTSPNEIIQIREELGPDFAHIKILAKVENYDGIKRFDDIVSVSDGIIVSRGNMGIDIPPEKVFMAQKSLIGRANMAQKPVILATQILDSMTEKPRPTRAEAGDVANAILDGADCLMLSKETAIGKFPLKSVQNLCAICHEAEAAVFHKRLFRDLLMQTPDTTDCTQTMAIAAVEASFKCAARAIIVLTASGRSAQLISAYRPRCVIIAVTRSQHTARSLHLHRGILPVLHLESFPDTKNKKSEWMEDVDTRIERALYLGKRRSYLKPNDMVVLVTGWQAGSGATNTVRLIPVPEGDQLPYAIFTSA